MRATTKIYFIDEGEELYNTETGDYSVQEASRTLRRANVTDTGETRMALLYGAIKQGAKTVRLNRGYNKPFDYIEIDGVLYKDSLNKQIKNRRVYEVHSL